MRPTQYTLAVGEVIAIEAKRVAALDVVQKYTCTWVNGMPYTTRVNGTPFTNANDIVAFLDWCFVNNYRLTPGFRETEKWYINMMNSANINRRVGQKLSTALRSSPGASSPEADSYVFETNAATRQMILVYNTLCLHYATQAAIMKWRMGVWMNDIKYWYPNIPFTYAFPNAVTGPPIEPMTYITSLTGEQTYIREPYGDRVISSYDRPPVLESAISVIYQ
jgi:hypothetical protein